MLSHLIAAAVVCSVPAQRDPDLYPEVAAYLAARSQEFDQIDAQRRERLDALAGYVRERRLAGEPVSLLFVCTHNSRRSHMAQLWAAAAGAARGLEISTYSGGTEATAFNPRAVAALTRAGFRIDTDSTDSNPLYVASFGGHHSPMTCFSKVFDTPPNPVEGFAAVMVCAEADQACPVVAGAEVRFALPYVDPKVSDNTPAEAQTYDERCAQIAREMLYVMEQAAG
jgi:arsenate reductase